MRNALGFLLFTVRLVRCGLCAPAALAADDESMGPLKEQAGPRAAAAYELTSMSV
jgi:hypothetical protein